MARRKKETTKMVARDAVTLNSLFTGIANAIRTKTETSDPISPRNMGNAIRELRRVAEASLPESSLPAIFQDIANAIRACGITGTMTATQISEKIGDIVPYKKTKVTYTQESGLPDWEGVIEGEIAGTSSSPTSQIPNVNQAKTIRIGDDVTSIGSYAFFGCSVLTSVTIPDGVTSIGDSAFYDCSGLTSVTIPNSVTSIGNYAFRGCSGLTSVTIPDSLTVIGNYVFYGCSGLTSVTIPSSVTILGTYTFRGCTGLVNIVLEEGFQTIGNGAFFGCTGLTRVSFPSTIGTISNAAFSGCTNLAIFDFRKSTSVPTLARTTAFNNTPSDKWIIVPDSLYDTWISTSNWSSSTNGIKKAILKASDVPTVATYTQASGLTDWSGEIFEEIVGTSSMPYYTSQIPNV